MYTNPTHTLLILKMLFVADVFDAVLNCTAVNIALQQQ